MKKKFNITGLCFPQEHYMADVSKKLEQAYIMVENGDYFIINRPRQYGKTTTLYCLADTLRKTGDYIVLNTSFEGIGDIVFNDKKVVLMIDEVDKSSNNQLFISFLAMLRNKYLERSSFKTFHSVVLAGVHDVKSLKLKIRPDEEGKFNSPWNIAAEFTVDMNLQVSEIKPMLDEYAADKGVKMDTQDMSELLFYYTSGYPFLVSKLCKMLDEAVLQTKAEKEWNAHDLELRFNNW